MTNPRTTSPRSPPTNLSVEDPPVTDPRPRVCVHGPRRTCTYVVPWWERRIRASEGRRLSLAGPDRLFLAPANGAGRRCQRSDIITAVLATARFMIDDPVWSCMPPVRTCRLSCLIIFVRCMIPLCVAAPARVNNFEARRSQVSLFFFF